MVSAQLSSAQLGWCIVVLPLATVKPSKIKPKCVARSCLLQPHQRPTRVTFGTLLPLIRQYYLTFFFFFGSNSNMYSDVWAMGTWNLTFKLFFFSWCVELLYVWFFFSPFVPNPNMVSTSNKKDYHYRISLGATLDGLYIFSF